MVVSEPDRGAAKGRLQGPQTAQIKNLIRPIEQKRGFPCLCVLTPGLKLTASDWNFSNKKSAGRANPRIEADSGARTTFLMARTPKPKARRPEAAKRVKVSKRTKAAKPRTGSEPPLSQASCPIVGIGASAGGLDAFQRFFSKTPADSGMAFVLVPHLDAHHKSAMVELLRAYTRMPVVEIADRAQVEADHVYVIPPNATLSIAHGALHTMTPRSRGMTIDDFFGSLARDQGDNAIGVILSGSGSDGTVGLTAIKEAGGLTFAQAPESSAFDSMPRSAAATGSVDFILAVEDIPARVVEQVRHLARLKAERKLDGFQEEVRKNLAKITTLLRSKTGHDFAHYKESTCIRRVQRRMHVHQLTSASDYLELLRKDPAEPEALFRDLLIGVTQFFRDGKAFDALKTRVIPKLLEGKRADDQIRVWAPGFAVQGADLRHRYRQSRPGYRAQRHLSPGGRARSAGGEAEPVFHQAGEHVPHRQGDPRDVHLLAAQSHQGHTVLEARPDLLPQPPDLFRPGPAAAGACAVPFRLAPARISVPGARREHHSAAQAVLPGGFPRAPVQSARRGARARCAGAVARGSAARPRPAGQAGYANGPGGGDPARAAGDRGLCARGGARRRALRSAAFLRADRQISAAEPRRRKPQFV